MTPDQALKSGKRDAGWNLARQTAPSTHEYQRTFSDLHGQLPMWRRLLWVEMTITFELALGRVVLDPPWGRILSDYDIFRGGLMVFALVFLALSPLVAARFRARFT